MIGSYKDKRTERFADGEHIKAFEGIAPAAERRLAMLNETESLDQLRSIRGNRLEALRGDRVGQHSIRINRQWRICFIWNEREKSAEQVEITDYH